MRVIEAVRTLRDVLRNPDLRRLELAWGASVTSEWAFVVSVSVFAYAHGGTAAVGAVALIRMLPAALAAPFAASPGDRYPRERVLLAAHAVRAVGTAGTAAAAFADAPAPLVYVLAGMASIVNTSIAPAQAALLPSLVRKPRELTASNLASSTIEGIGTMAGPAGSAVVLAISSTGSAFLLSATLLAVAALLVAGIHVDRPRALRPGAETGGFLRQALGGFRTIGLEGNVRLLIGLVGAQTLVRGALNVLIVVSALKLLALGNSGVGLMTAAIGVGGVLGAFAALQLVGRHRLARPFGLGLALWGLPIALIGIWPDATAAIVLLAIVGVGNTLVDVAGLTLLQRAVPDYLLARVFGALESIAVGTIGLGAIITPLIIPGLGVRGTLIATGAMLPLLAVLLWPRLRVVDAEAIVPGDEVDLLESISIFAPLPRPILERLAASLVAVEASSGEPIVCQGDEGDRFYVIAAGNCDVTIDGSLQRVLGPGDYFGEIALLRDIPRTATVAGRTAVRLFALERNDFLGAVTGHAPSAEAAEAVVGARLGSLRTGIASV